MPKRCNGKDNNTNSTIEDVEHTLVERATRHMLIKWHLLATVHKLHARYAAFEV